jgi:hypothetical protein
MNGQGQLTVGPQRLHNKKGVAKVLYTHFTANKPDQTRSAYISSCSKFHLMRALSWPLPPALGALAFEALFAPLLPVDSRAG